MITPIRLDISMKIINTINITVTSHYGNDAICQSRNIIQSPVSMTTILLKEAYLHQYNGWSYNLTKYCTLTLYGVMRIVCTLTSCCVWLWVHSSPLIISTMIIVKADLFSFIVYSWNACYLTIMIFIASWNAQDNSSLDLIAALMIFTLPGTPTFVIYWDVMYTVHANELPEVWPCVNTGLSQSIVHNPVHDR